MSLDTLLGFPEGYLSRLADALDPPHAPDEAQPTKTPSARRIRVKTPSGAASGEHQEVVPDAKHPGGIGKVKA